MTIVNSVSPITKYLTVYPGQTSVLKKSVKILSIMNDGGVSYTTTCGSLPPAQNALAYKLTWTYQTGSGDQEAWEWNNDHPKITTIQLGGVFYIIDISIAQPIDIVAKIKTIPQLAAVMLNIEPISINTHGNGLYQNGFKFNTIPSIAADIYAVPLVFAMSANTRIYPELNS